MAQDPAYLNPQQQKRLSKKAAQAQQIQDELSPPWFPDAAWHVRTLGLIYAVLVCVFFGITHLLRKLPRPYHLRRIPVEMTPWLAPGGKVHLDEDALRAPDSPTLPPQDRTAPKK